ncbi:glycosylphosphatidylinositol anchor biosynthesis [Neocucurbitaria cava]|uniref:Mannosyltransferase n=1 Tax=Neocucurbitaria cava TaxID=798079 RepID=A0A9W9CJ62_9PLEO|nr:glycosylphosphatidylinositol anchor biosynthesis [Neocucurbitaria cava]
MPPSSDSARDTTPSGTGAPPPSRLTSYRDSRLGVFSLLLALRIVNALTLRTFFQPDEFFQSLEPAWQLAFGQTSNAWITWEWRTQLRSSLHPALFATVYRVAADLGAFCGLNLPARAELLLAAPKLIQAVFAALLDCYTWKLAEKAYGRGSRTALTTPLRSFGYKHAAASTTEFEWSSDSEVTDNARSAVLACSIASDRLYYEVWTLPPLRFLYFNIAQSLAVFYGSNRADYYITEGLPLLLTTALPFAAIGIWQSLHGSEPERSPMTGESSTSSPVTTPTETAIQRSILKRLAWASLVVTLTLSLISHKEVRFLYPILPFLHLIAAKPLASFLPTHAPISRKTVIFLLFATNLLLAGYASQIHQRGVIDVLSYIRHKHETRNGLSASSSSTSQTRPISNTTVGFLMPCHSTPWRSHLIYPQISAWALTCEPPIDIPLPERSTYLDEADEFYLKPGPAAWLRSNMESTDTIQSGGSRSGQHWMKNDPRFKRKYKREWPQNLVFFEQLEGTLKEHLDGTRYTECWRGFNSHFHDDHRRVGDVIVWCLDGA